MGFIKGAPPLPLVQLINVPKETWIGRGVFHAMTQKGKKPFWDENELPPELDGWQEGDPPKTTVYDVGVVLSYQPCNISQYDDVIFITSDGTTLKYNAYWLWTPKLEKDIDSGP